jgi:4-amino-4-deoxy-L-arabinose transferase-like glycosyltransferase
MSFERRADRRAAYCPTDGWRCSWNDAHGNAGCFFLSLSLALLVQSLSTLSLGISISSAVASGVLLGMAVLGRQSYLVVLPCLLTLVSWDARIWAKNLFLVGVLWAATAAVVAPLFLI